MAAEKALQNLRISEHLYGWPEIRKFWRRPSENLIREANN